MDDDFPAGVCTATDTDTGTATGMECETEAAPVTTSGAATSGTANTCQATADCMGGRCVAPWDATSEVRGEFACEFACVALIDETRWCADDASCCEPAARCTARGYCIIEGESTSTSGDATSTGTGSTGG
jgi:hypothetical protein